jgi:glycosyltransferase involved in cell wall biosynthesis
MSAGPLVSAVMPVYNSEQYIDATLASVCAQTYQNLEIIIVDDGSGDAGPEIIGRYAAAHPNITCIRQKNSGVSAARNRGIRASKGDFIAFIDSDDLWGPTKIEEQVRAVRESGMSASYCGHTNLFEETGALVPNKSRRISGDILISFLRNEVWPMTSTWMVGRDIMTAHDIWFDEDTSWGEDGEFFIKIASLAKVCAVNSFLATYRIRNESLSGYRIAHRNLVDVWVRTRDWIRDRSGRTDAGYCARIIDEFRIPSVIIRSLYEERKLGLRGAGDHFVQAGVDSRGVKLAGIIRHCHFRMDALRLSLMKFAATNDWFFRLVRFTGKIIYRKK